MVKTIKIYPKLLVRNNRFRVYDIKFSYFSLRLNPYDAGDDSFHTFKMLPYVSSKVTNIVINTIVV